MVYVDAKDKTHIGSQYLSWTSVGCRYAKEIRLAASDVSVTSSYLDPVPGGQDVDCKGRESRRQATEQTTIKAILI